MNTISTPGTELSGAYALSPPLGARSALAITTCPRGRRGGGVWWSTTVLVSSLTFVRGQGHLDEAAHQAFARLLGPDRSAPDCAVARRHRGGPRNRCREQPSEPMASASSFRPDPQLLDDRPPFFGIGLLHCGQCLWCLFLARKNLQLQSSEARSNRRIRQCLDGRRIEFGDDVLRRALGREKPAPLG